MPERYSPRERVLASLRHEEPDRVPTALWGSYYALTDEAYFRLLDHFGLGEPVPPFRRSKPRNTNYLDDRILDRLGTDLRYVWSGFTDLGGAQPATLTDAWGVRWERVGGYLNPASAPLAHITTVEEIEAHPWPEPEPYMRLDELRERLAALRRDGRYAIAARAVNSYGPFEQASALRGREQLLMDLVLAPELARHLILKTAAVIARLYTAYLEVAGPWVDLVELPGDDYAGNEHLLISPKLIEGMIVPALAHIIQAVRRSTDHAYITLHSDGAIAPLLPAFARLGVDVIHPLEPLPANDLAAIKAQWGATFTFLGGIDIRSAMPGSVADVETEVRERLRVLAPGGGYILAPANHLQRDVPPQNIVALYECARRYGRYA
jgi:uroporphyrinogen decarboxylase